MTATASKGPCTSKPKVQALRYTYSGTISVPRNPTFLFATIAPSQSKARANGIAQFARALNLNNVSMQAEIKRLGDSCQIEIQKVSEKPFLTRAEQRASASTHPREH